MALQRIDENFDKLVTSVLGNLDPPFPTKNKKVLYEIAVIDFLQKWFEITKEKDQLSQKQKLRHYLEKMDDIQNTLISNGWMPKNQKRIKK